MVKPIPRTDNVIEVDRWRQSVVDTINRGLSNIPAASSATAVSTLNALLVELKAKGFMKET